MANCIICAEFDNCPWRAEPNAMCSRYRQRKMTNGDRIRSMLDEELADYLDGVCHDLWQMFVADPQKMWLDWLKQEVNK